MEKAKIHSLETMGLVDGPGIRVVVFMQGCRLRCVYCHNPDTWQLNLGEEITSIDLLAKVKRYKSFFKASGGGVTLSGGEPLLQPEFVSEFFRMCRDEGIHTALDTAGNGLGEYGSILKYTDLIILDIKHIEKNGYRKLTGQSMDEFLKFLEAAGKDRNKLWIRNVVVPGITDSEEHIKGLAEFINTIPNVEKVELLPYHVYGINKYKKMGIPYSLDGVPPLSENKLDGLYWLLQQSLRDSHLKSNGMERLSMIV